MAIVKMKHLRLAAMQSDREALLRLLQGMGCLEIEEPSVDWSDPEWAGLKSPDSGALSAARAAAAHRCLSTLKHEKLSLWFRMVKSGFAIVDFCAIA